MIKKLSISNQLFIIFVSILLFASCAFSIITLVSVNRIAEKQVFSRLNSYAGILNPNRDGPRGSEFQDNTEPLAFKDMEVGYLVVFDNNFYERGIESYITQEELDALIAPFLEDHPYGTMHEGSVKTSVKRIFYFIRILMKIITQLYLLVQNILII